MEVNELKIGDEVCNIRTKFPMKVVGLFEDGTVYLDFEGNEGDIWEEQASDLEFVNNTNMEQKGTFIDRLIQEQNELEGKLTKLRSFINTRMTEVVEGDYQKQLLKLQERVMTRYNDILKSRLGQDGDSQDTTHLMTFGEAIEVLRAGGAIKRDSWSNVSFVTKQIPAMIDNAVIPKMTSLSQTAKDLLLNDMDGIICYNYQALMVRPNGMANSWSPSIEDVFATDWMIVTPSK